MEEVKTKHEPVKQNNALYAIVRLKTHAEAGFSQAQIDPEMLAHDKAILMIRELVEQELK